jgi:primosomal protein N' (replication factor Y)
MPSDRLILRIAVPSPLHRTFDYLPPTTCNRNWLVPGVRVKVPFGRSSTVGVLVDTAGETLVEEARLKKAWQVIDTEPMIPSDIMNLARWASSYYHHPLGEVLSTALPVLLRKGAAAEPEGVRSWQLTASGQALSSEELRPAPRQAALHALLRRLPEGARREQLEEQPGDWQGALRAMIEKGWVRVHKQAVLVAPDTERDAPHPLNIPQQQAVDALCTGLGIFQPFLLHGVTGSGKTEVYLRVIEQVLERDEQALVLVPEIGLTPQLIERFRRRFPVPLAVLHSSLSDRERLNAWLAAREGAASIVIGTRSAVFTPLRKPGIIIVDEEHDPSFKQHEGFRYSARDLAVMRARSARIPVVLASATPSLESLYNALQSRYRLLELPERAGSAIHPHMNLLDVRGEPMEDGLSEALLQHMRQHLQRGGQVLLFLNRRGYAPTLLCHDCGWVAECHRCDSHMTYHQGHNRLRCHHCGSERPVDVSCPACGSVDLRPVGQGTERIEQTLQKHFPDIGMVRIDRDSTRRKGAMQSKLDSIKSGASRILIGTQMLAKGHDFPDVTLVGMVDSDQGLFSADFRASERMAQLVLQVAGRAGRADKPGEVLIQTHHPDHPLLQLLVGQDYGRFAKAALVERQEAGLPPYSNLALLRAEANTREPPRRFLEQALERAQQYDLTKVQVFGPVPAPMERRKGRYRAQLLLQAEQRADLHSVLKGWVMDLEQIKEARKVRWSLDVDPMDML